MSKTLNLTEGEAAFLRTIMRLAVRDGRAGEYARTHPNMAEAIRGKLEE